MKKVAVTIHTIKNFKPDIIKGLEGLEYIHNRKRFEKI